MEHALGPRCSPQYQKREGEKKKVLEREREGGRKGRTDRERLKQHD